MDSARAAIETPGDEAPPVVPPAERCHRALRMRDARFDGRFFVGVRTTGIFCRPICPAPTPKPAHCSYWPSAAAAQAAGFRPCLRCRPEAAPGTPAWQGTAATVTRALRLIEAGALDGGGKVDGLAARLGIGPRHLRRLFDHHLGTTPSAVARLRRVLFAKQLIDETMLPLSEVALASGFSSPRRFHACMREVYGRAPSELRRRRPSEQRRRRPSEQRRRRPSATARRPKAGRHQAGEKQSRAAGAEASSEAQTASSGLVLSLSYRPPYAWDILLGFLRARAIPGVESVGDDAYRRTIQLGESTGWLRATHDATRSRLRVEVSLASSAGLLELRARLGRLFDVAADVEAIDAVLSQLPRLRRQVEASPGVRVPGAFDGFETAVRAILGQQVSVRGATTLAGRLVARFGTRLPELATTGPEAERSCVTPPVERLFPTAEALQEADLESIGLVRARAATIRVLARTLVDAPDWLDSGDGLVAATERLESLPGIGPWTAQYVAMRVLREPDALPATDLGLRKALRASPADGPVPAEQVRDTLEHCRPFRAYGAMRLWQSLAGA